MRADSGWAVVAMIVVLAGCGNGGPAVDPGYLAEIETWHADRVAQLEAEDGWLSLVGLHWLEVGDNTLGAAGSNRIVVPDGAAPDEAAVITVNEDSTVHITAREGVAMQVNGEPAVQSSLATDTTGAADTVTIGRLTFYIIERGERPAVRMKDPEAPTRVHFDGVDRFPVDPSFRVEAVLEPFDEPQERTIATAIGTADTVLVPGVLRFTIADREVTLEPFADSVDEPLFIVFRDATSGETTYGAGRFLSTGAPVDGRVVLDFNRAVNPPCAFTPYATCPLPPTANVLDVEIRAGEQYTGDH